MERVEKEGKVEKLEKQAGEKRRPRGLGHPAEEKCEAVLTLWTERRKPGEICRELGVAWNVLQQWQDRAMEGMLLALQPRVTVERGVALSPRLAVLLEKKSRAGLLQGIDKRLKRLQKSIPGSQPVPAEKT
jgi:transposase-like protein